METVLSIFNFFKFQKFFILRAMDFSELNPRLDIDGTENDFKEVRLLLSGNLIIVNLVVGGLVLS